MRRTPMVASLILLGLLIVAGLLPRLRQYALLREDAPGGHPTVVVLHPHVTADAGLTLPASMQAVDATILSARQTGYLSKYLVDIGSRVHKGQLLALLQAPDTDQQLEQARAQHMQSVAAVAQSRSDEVRLSASTSAARSQMVQAEAQLSHAQAAEAQAAAQVAAARRQVAQAEAERDKAKEAERLALRNYQRQQQLLSQGFTTAQDADTAEAAWKEAQSDTVAAQRTVEAAQASLHAQEAARRSAQADVAASRANLEAAAQNVGAASAAEHSGLSAIDAADANRQAAVANLNRYQTLQGFERVVAPFDGVITNRYADTGALITADGSNKAQLFSIARLSTLRVQLQVPEAYVLPLQEGQKAVITVKELPGRTFDSRITKVAHALDPTTRTELVEVWTDNRDGSLLPGMYANVSLQPPMKPALRIPGTALITDSRGSGVDVVTDDKKVHYRKVTVGRDFGTDVEILEGVAANDNVVDTPSDTLTDGESVDTVDPPEPPKP